MDCCNCCFVLTVFFIFITLNSCAVHSADSDNISPNSGSGRRYRAASSTEKIFSDRSNNADEPNEKSSKDGMIPSEFGRAVAVRDTPATEEVLSTMKKMLKEIGALKETVSELKAQSSVVVKQLKMNLMRCSSDVSTSTGSGVVSGGGKILENPLKSNVITSGALLMDSVPLKVCPEDFTYYPEFNGCYKIAADRVTWRMARERCLAQDADLATVESSRKHRFIIERAKSSPETRHCDFWIGLTRTGSSMAAPWKWISTGDALGFTNWNTNEPNNGKGNEHCAQMLWVFHWKWNDAGRNYGNSCYICQSKANI